MPKDTATVVGSAGSPTDRLIAALSALAGHHSVEDTLKQVFPTSHPNGARGLDALEAMALLAETVVSLQAEVSQFRSPGWRRRQRWRHHVLAAVLAALVASLTYVTAAPHLESLVVALLTGG